MKLHPAPRAATSQRRLKQARGEPSPKGRGRVSPWLRGWGLGSIGVLAAGWCCSDGALEAAEPQISGVLVPNLGLGRFRMGRAQGISEVWVWDERCPTGVSGGRRDLARREDTKGAGFNPKLQQVPK